MLAIMSDEERKAYAQWQKEWKARQREFVLHSEQIAGRGFEDGGEEGFWESPGVVEHLKLAETLNRPNTNYVGVWLINSALTRRPNKCTRTGNQGLSKGLVPEGKDVDAFIQRLDTKIREDFVIYKNAGAEEKNMLAWHAHDEVLCSDLFKSGNARTGRLLLNHVRTIFCLDTFVIRYEKSAEYYAKLHEYKMNTYLPKLRVEQVAA